MEVEEVEVEVEEGVNIARCCLLSYMVTTTFSHYITK